MVTEGLRRWFVVHFAVDMLFGIPLLIAPHWILSLFGWQTIDPFMARLVGAALMGIGIESYLGRNAGVEAFRGMLNLKVIWSLTATLGTGYTLLVGDAPAMGWLVVAMFAVFHGLWLYYRVQLGRLQTV
ncbi:MAG: hypothetical protein Q9P44_16555 [Anaerolineae bacterium]|nr:hypothetical protein [Anaerolineae bacterium]